MTKSIDNIFDIKGGNLISNLLLLPNGIPVMINYTNGDERKFIHFYTSQGILYQKRETSEKINMPPELNMTVISIGDRHEPISHRKTIEFQNTGTYSIFPGDEATKILDTFLETYYPKETYKKQLNNAIKHAKSPHSMYLAIR